MPDVPPDPCTAALSDPDPAVRGRAVRDLRSRGGAGPDSLPALLALDPPPLLCPRTRIVPSLVLLASMERRIVLLVRLLLLLMLMTPVEALNAVTAGEVDARIVKLWLLPHDAVMLIVPALSIDRAVSVCVAVLVLVRPSVSFASTAPDELTSYFRSVEPVRTAAPSRSISLASTTPLSSKSPGIVV